MSLNDPILRDIKGHLLKLHEDAIHKPVTDVHPNLLPFCHSLESALRKGLKRASSAVGSTKQDYWIWIYNLPDHVAQWASVNERNMTVFKAAIEMTRRHPKLKTTQGRGRYFLRLSLLKHIISVPVILLMKSGNFRTKFYDVDTSLLGDDYLCEVLLSALQEVDGIEFSLNMQNSSFLDETWLLPIYRCHEFIPCRHLGIKIGYIGGRAVAVHVKEGSPAADDDIIEVGDILDELFGESLYDCKRSKIPTLLRRHRGKPISVAIIKGHFHSGELYPPAASILRQLGISVESLTVTYKRKQLEKKTPDYLDAEETQCEMHDLLMRSNCDNIASFGHRVFYIGNVYVGEDGSKDKITNGIMEVMKTSTTKQDVILETQEAHLLVKDFKTGKVLFEHCYTRIGACGRPKSPASFFAYTIGETTCSLSSHFTCYVFQADNPEMSKEILLNVAKGFERTHWAV